MKNLKRLTAMCAAFTLTAMVMAGCGADKRSSEDTDSVNKSVADEAVKETEKAEETEESAVGSTEMINKSDRLMGMTADQITDAFYENDLSGVLEYDNGTYGMPDSAVAEMNSLFSFMTKENHFTVVGNAEAKDSYLVYIVDKECDFDSIAIFDKDNGSLVSTTIYDMYKEAVSRKSVAMISDGTLETEGFNIGFPRKWSSRDDSTFGSYQLTLPDVEVLCNEAKQDAVDTMNKMKSIVEECDAHGLMKEVEIVRGLEKPSQRLIDMGFAKEGDPEFELPGISYDEAEFRRLQRLNEDMENGEVSVIQGEEALSGVSAESEEPELGTMDTNASIPPKHNAKKAGYKRAGEYRYGYVDIPESYSSFEKTESLTLNTAKSWSEDKTCGVDIMYFPNTAITLDQALKEASEGTIETFETVGVSYETDTTDVSIDHGKYTGKKFSCKSDSNIATGVLVFEGTDGYIHVIQTITDTAEEADYILESYSLTDVY